MPQDLSALLDDIAATQALVDQAQAHFEAHKHLWTEEFAWHMQAEIDVKRFELETAKLTITMLSRL